MQDSPVATLSCRIEQIADSLRVAYVVRNTSNSDVGIFNRLEDGGRGGAPFRPENAYIDLEGTTLRVQKIVLPVPKGLAMTARPVPNVTRLPPGQDFREDLSLPLPIPVYNPLRRAELAAASPRETIVAAYPKIASTVELDIGVFESSPVIKFIPISAEFPDIYRLWPPGPPVDNQIVLSETVNLASTIAVLDYGAIPRE
jgi:hypothetical protein